MHNAATFDLPGFLDAVGVSGLAITGAVNPGVVAYLQKCDDSGIPASSNHRSFTYALGLVVPKTLSCDHQGDARLTFDVIVLGDGTNDPVVISDAATLPTITQTASRWTLGPVTLGGVTFSKYTGFEIDFGNDVQTRGSQSNLDPTHCEQKTHSPKITLTGIDPAWFSSSNVPVGGLAVVTATDKLFLRKRSQAGGTGFVANGTSGHIKFALAGLAGVQQGARAEMQRTSETTVVVTLAKDSAGNNPLIMTTATTIA